MVHSVRGQSRASCAIVGYFMMKYNWGVYKTLEFLNSRRQDLEIRTSFLKQLEALESRIEGAKSRGWDDVSESNEAKGEKEERVIRNTFVNSLGMKEKLLVSLNPKENDARNQVVKWKDSAKKGNELCQVIEERAVDSSQLLFKKEKPMKSSLKKPKHNKRHSQGGEASQKDKEIKMVSQMNEGSGGRKSNEGNAVKIKPKSATIGLKERTMLNPNGVRSLTGAENKPSPLVKVNKAELRNQLIIKMSQASSEKKEALKREPAFNKIPKKAMSIYSELFKCKGNDQNIIQKGDLNQIKKNCPGLRSQKGNQVDRHSEKGQELSIKRKKKSTKDSNIPPKGQQSHLNKQKRGEEKDICLFDQRGSLISEVPTTNAKAKTKSKDDSGNKETTGESRQSKRTIEEGPGFDEKLKTNWELIDNSEHKKRNMKIFGHYLRPPTPSSNQPNFKRGSSVIHQSVPINKSQSTKALESFSKSLSKLIDKQMVTTKSHHPISRGFPIDNSTGFSKLSHSLVDHEQFAEIRGILGRNMRKTDKGETNEKSWKKSKSTRESVSCANKMEKCDYLGVTEDELKRTFEEKSRFPSKKTRESSGLVFGIFHWEIEQKKAFQSKTLRI